MSGFERISQQLDILGGRPCIRGMSVTVGMVVGMIGAGHSIEAILADYPYLEREDIGFASCRYEGELVVDLSFSPLIRSKRIPKLLFGEQCLYRDRSFQRD